MANHKESYALMWYGCSCGHRLRAWNSRDGVTPFGINCPSCGGIANHVDWNKDEKAYAHKPFPGQVVFRDLTRLDSEEIAHKRLKARGIDPMTYDRLEELIDSIYGDGKQPKVTFYSEEKLPRYEDLKTAFDEWHSKTDWVQEAFDKNLLPAGLLGRHRADVLREICEPIIRGEK